MAAFEIVALDTVTPQLRAPGAGDTYLAPRAIGVTPAALTGSDATSSLSIAQTWNTSGTPSAFDLNVTDTASNAASLLMNLRVGGVSRFSVDKTGAVVISDGANALTIDSSNGATTFLQIAAISFQTSNSLIMRHGNGDAFGIRAVSGAVDPKLDFLNTSNLTQVRLTTDAANTLAQRRGAEAQAFNIYNTFTDASNYERMSVKWASNRVTFDTEAAGTGSIRSLRFGGFESNGNLSASPVVGCYSGKFEIISGNFLEMSEQTAPTAPAVNKVRIYAEDNGAGKTRLMARFATGAAQQIAIEP